MSEIGQRMRPRLEPGLHGWLLAFVLWIGVVSPLWTVGFSIFAVEWLELKNPEDAALMRELNWDVLLWGTVILRAGMRVAAALMMYFRRVSSSVWFSIAALWLSGPLLIIGTWVAIESEINLVGLARSALIALGWTLFLFLSPRVKLTYGFRASA